jgi:hypothetical protein
MNSLPTFPYPAQFEAPLWPQLADEDWEPDELNEPADLLRMEVCGRDVAFAEFVDFQRREIDLILWPSWLDWLGPFALIPMLMGIIKSTKVRVEMGVDCRYSIWVGESKVPRHVGLEMWEMRRAVRKLVAAF